ncbi:MAG: cobalamin-binding protein [Acidiferrobacteraceae bacterium]|nr:cobalamin-binding protein [Acidiferrobacteraceae bacterium]
MHHSLKVIGVFAALIASTFHANAEVVAVDDTGRTISLSKPANRVVSMAPNITEILFHVGAGPQIVGVVEYSDFPPEAQEITSVGSSNQFDLEAILLLQPDLVIAWDSGNPAEDIRKLEDLGLAVYRSEPRTLEDVASTMDRLAALTGHKAHGEAQSQLFRKHTSEIRGAYENRLNLRVFYQIWSDPIYTLNGDHLISRLVEGCGGTNIFSDAETLAPIVSTEAVIDRNPEVIIAGGYAGEPPKWLSEWNQWSSIAATANGHLYTVNTDRISRMGPRLVEGMRELCESIDKARPQG